MTSRKSATKIPQLVHNCDQKEDRGGSRGLLEYRVFVDGEKLVRRSQYDLGVRRSKRIAWRKRPRNQRRRKPGPRVRPGTSNGEVRLERAGQVAHGAHDEGLERPRSETPMKVGVAVREEEPEGGKAHEGSERTKI